MDKNRLIDEITAVVMERLANEGRPSKVVVFGEVPPGVVGGGCEIQQGSSPADAMDADYIVLSADAFRAFHHMPPRDAAAKSAAEPEHAPAAEHAKAEPALAAEHAPAGRVIDMRGNRLIHEMDLRRQNLRKGDVVRVDANAIITALAYDYVGTMDAVISNE